MREVRIYQAGIYSAGQSVALSEEAGQHVAVVLRMREGQVLTLFNGENNECQATIHYVKKKQVLVQLGEVRVVSRESPLRIHLAQAISKGDRMEFVMQKATELGVASITPLLTERSVVALDHERMLKKIRQWQAIVIAACEQSGRNMVPVVQTPIHLEQFLAQVNTAMKLILDPCAHKTWRDYAPFSSDISLLIGPEGGFSARELDLAHRFDYSPLSLGPRVLRTETAAISTLSLLQAVGGDL